MADDKIRLSDSMKAGRISCHGKITSLETAFRLDKASPFSLFIIPKDGSQTPVVANVKLIHEDAASACPFAVNCWTETNVFEIAAEAIDLTDYDVYWGAPEFDEVSE